MRIVNYTKLDDNQLSELFEFAARGVRDSGVELHVKNEPRHPHGYCYWHVPDMANVSATTRALITIHLPSTPDSPLWPKAWWNGHGLKRLAMSYPDVPFDDWRDCVVYIAAHEFRHVWQHDRRRRAKSQGKRASGKREHDASKHGITRLNAYRILTGRTPLVRVKQANPFAVVA